MVGRQILAISSLRRQIRISQGIASVLGVVSQLLRVDFFENREQVEILLGAVSTKTVRNISVFQVVPAQKYADSSFPPRRES